MAWEHDVILISRKQVDEDELLQKSRKKRLLATSGL